MKIIKKYLIISWFLITEELVIVSLIIGQILVLLIGVYFIAPKENIQYDIHSHFKDRGKYVYITKEKSSSIREPMYLIMMGTDKRMNGDVYTMEKFTPLFHTEERYYILLISIPTNLSIFMA